MKTLVVERDGRITVHEVNKPRYNEYQALVKTICLRHVRYRHQAHPPHL